MFNNIGGKIKTVATVFCWIGIAFSIIGGVIMLFCGIAIGDVGGVMLALLGILVAALGAFCSWLGSLGLYGFGELIACVQRIDRKLNGSDENDGFWNGNLK